jgi:hypothetical protein
MKSHLKASLGLGKVVLPRYAFFSCTFFLCLLGAFKSADAVDIPLSKQEQEFLKKNPEIHFVSLEQHAPYGSERAECWDYG